MELPANTWPLLFGATCTLRTVFTTTASCSRSMLPLEGDRARKYRSRPAPGMAAWPAGTLTSANTSRFAPPLTTPVLVMMAPATLRNTTVQPVGKVSAAKLAVVLADRS